MRIWLNKEPLTIPSSLSEITLKQRIDYQNEHGNLLNEMVKSISEIPDEDERGLELLQIQVEGALRGISFFTGYNLEVLRVSEFIDKLLNIYAASIAQCFKEETAEMNDPKYEFVWNNEEWVIQQPELKNGDKMTFGELVDSKQVVQDMMGLGKSRWECLLPLCAIYLHKKDEVYQENFLYENSERLKLMESLPLDIALQVSFFLNSSVSTYIEISQSFNLQESNQLETI